MGPGFDDSRLFSPALILPVRRAFGSRNRSELEPHFNSNTAFTCAVTVAFWGLNSSVGAAS
jgi:hypothetical protein